MRFKKLDLNLLVALDVLLKERSVSRAAEVLNLSASATSNALARLREYFDDELLVQIGRKMELTPRAEGLHAAVRDVLLRIDSTIATQPAFEPDRSDRMFRIFASDYTQVVLGSCDLADVAVTVLSSVVSSQADHSVIDAGALALSKDLGSELAPHEIEEWQPWARPQDDAERRMAQWLEESLRASRARWKIVIGHHPLWSSAGSKFEQARALRRMILPALCRYADLYLAGHDHTLELHTDDCAGSGAPAGMEPLPQLVSGAGGKQRGINRLFRDNQLRLYPQLRTLYARGMVWGFAQLVIDGDRAQLRIVATPDDGNGSRTTEFEHAFERRTRLLRSGAAHGGGT